MSKVMVLGDINIDLIFNGMQRMPEDGEELFVDQMNLCVGGSAANVAVGLAKLGVATSLHAVVSRDAFGQTILNYLTETGVDQSKLVLSDRVKSGVSVGLSNGEDRSFVSYMGNNALIGEQSIESKIDDKVLMSYDLVHFSLFNIDVCFDYYFEIASRCHSLGVKTSLDIGGTDFDCHKEKICDLLKVIDIFFPNYYEASKLCQSVDMADMAKKIRQFVNEIAVITNGEQGSWAFDGESLHHQVYRVAAVDAVGAGDAFDAGFLSAYLAKLPLAECVNRGSACGGIVASRHGGGVTTPALEEIERFIASNKDKPVMNSYQRVMNAIAGKPVDRTPVWPFVMEFASNYANIPYSEYASNYQRLVEAQIKVVEDFELDAVVIDSDAYREASALGAVISFPENELPMMEQYAITDKAAFDFVIPDIYKCERLVDKINGVRLAKEYFKDEKPVVGWVEAPLQCAGTLYDLNEFMMDLVMEPEFIQKLIHFTTEFGIAFASEQIKAGADIIGVGDAMASMVSPDIYEQFILPSTKKLVQTLKSEFDVKLKYHMCGAATHILPYISEIGFDLVNIDCKVNAREAFEIVDDSVCIKGNIDNSDVILFGTPEMIREKAHELLALEQPKFILSPGCELPKNTPHENLKALVNSVR